MRVLEYLILLALVLGMIFYGIRIAHAGVDFSFSDKSSSSVYVSTSLYRWHLHEAAKSIENPRELDKELLIVKQLFDIYERKDDFIKSVFPDETLKYLTNEQHKNGYIKEAIQFHLDIFDREVKTLKDDYDIQDIKSLLISIREKDRLNQSYLKEADELKRITKIIEEAREMSQKVLSKEDIERIKELAKQTQYDAAKTIINSALLQLENVGASVVCLSEVIR